MASLQRKRLPWQIKPIDLAGLFTWLAVAFTLQYGPADQLALRWALAVLFLLCFFAEDWWPLPAAGRTALVLAQALCALALVGLQPRSGVSPVLLVMLVASLAATWPMRQVIAMALLLNLAMYALLRANGHEFAGMMTLIYAGFQMFAGTTVQASRHAEQARDQLAYVNADLLATRSLLADASRDAERMRVARELHDVLGHKLTALRINLRSLADAADAPDRLKLCEQLSAQLLDDVRGVVHAMRDADGLDIANSLHALAAPFPALRFVLRISPQVNIRHPALADTVLRVVQEALTNAARHGGARTLQVEMTMHEDTLHLHIEDDGQLHGELREGHGLTGMRERVEERCGTLAFSRSAKGGLRINAMLPA